MYRRCCCVGFERTGRTDFFFGAGGGVLLSRGAFGGVEKQGEFGLVMVVAESAEGTTQLEQKDDEYRCDMVVV